MCVRMCMCVCVCVRACMCVYVCVLCVRVRVCVIDQTPKDILVVQRDWNAKMDKNAYENWQGICGPFYNDETNERGLRPLEFATFGDLVLANTFGHHKDGSGIAQMTNTTIRLITFQ